MVSVYNFQFVSNYLFSNKCINHNRIQMYIQIQCSKMIKKTKQKQKQKKENIELPLRVVSYNVAWSGSQPYQPQREECHLCCYGLDLAMTQLTSLFLVTEYVRKSHLAYLLNSWLRIFFFLNWIKKWDCISHRFRLYSCMGL